MALICDNDTQSSPCRCLSYICLNLTGIAFPSESALENFVYFVSPRSNVTSSLRFYLIWSNFSLPLFIMYTSTLMIHMPLFLYLSHFPLYLLFSCLFTPSIVLDRVDLIFYPSTPKLASSWSWIAAVIYFGSVTTFVLFNNYFHIKIQISSFSGETKSQLSAGVGICLPSDFPPHHFLSSINLRY